LIGQRVKELCGISSVYANSGDQNTAVSYLTLAVQDISLITETDHKGLGSSELEEALSDVVQCTEEQAQLPGVGLLMKTVLEQVTRISIPSKRTWALKGLLRAALKAPDIKPSEDIILRALALADAEIGTEERRQILTM